MNKTSATVLTLLISALAVAMPVFFAISMARSLSLDATSQRVQLYASDVLQRTDDTAAQIEWGVARLVALAQREGDPCSEPMLRLMREIDLTSSYIQSMGRISGNGLLCSSLGRHDEPGIDVGAPGFVTSNGTLVRSDVTFDFTPDSHFILIESMGFVAIVHKDLPIDTTTQEDDALLAAYLLEEQEVLTARGDIPQAWFDRLMEGASTFQDSGYIVSTVKVG